jgi:hypothetical protein
MLQIAAMNRIFKGAVLTLAAADAADAAVGLPGVEPYQTPRTPLIEEVLKIRLMTLQPCLSDILSQSKWSTRAWTYEEEQFSRRISTSRNIRYTSVACIHYGAKTGMVKTLNITQEMMCESSLSRPLTY